MSDAGGRWDDLITRPLQPAGSERLSDQEVIAFCQALLVAGNENVSGLIGNLFLALARRPDEWKRLRDDPSRVPAAVEESLRFDSPNQGLFRHATRDVEMHGVTIPADTGDFRLISRRALDALLDLREHHRMMKGLFAWVGFRQKEVGYHREPRHAGKRKLD